MPGGGRAVAYEFVLLPEVIGTRRRAIFFLAAWRLGGFTLRLRASACICDGPASTGETMEIYPFALMRRCPERCAERRKIAAAPQTTTARGQPEGKGNCANVHLSRPETRPCEFDLSIISVRHRRLAMPRHCLRANQARKPGPATTQDLKLVQKSGAFQSASIRSTSTPFMPCRVEKRMRCSGARTLSPERRSALAWI